MAATMSGVTGATSAKFGTFQRLLSQACRSKAAAKHPISRRVETVALHSRSSIR